MNHLVGVRPPYPIWPSESEDFSTSYDAFQNVSVEYYTLAGGEDLEFRLGIDIFSVIITNNLNLIPFDESE